MSPPGVTATKLSSSKPDCSIELVAAARSMRRTVETLVAMTLVDPTYLPMLFNDPVGKKLVAGAVVWGAIGIFFIRRIIRVEV